MKTKAVVSISQTNKTPVHDIVYFIIKKKAHTHTPNRDSINVIQNTKQNCKSSICEFDLHSAKDKKIKHICVI